MKLPVSKLLELVENSNLDYRKKNIIGKCPKCGNNEFGMSIENNHLFGCFRKKKCGFSGNIFTYLKHIGKLSQFLNDDDYYERGELNRSLIKKIGLDVNEIVLDKIPCDLPVGYKRIFESKYLSSRNFTEFDLYEVGDSKLDPRVRNNYVVFPVREDDKIVGWVARHHWDKKRIEKYNEEHKKLDTGRFISRFINSYSDFSTLLYGIDEITNNTKTIILVEGIMDKINVDRVLELHESEEVKCLATFKCAISPTQLFKLCLFTNLNSVILLYDGDVIKDIKKSGNMLESHFNNVKIGVCKGDKDPGEMNLDEITYIFNNLKDPLFFEKKYVHKRKFS